MLLERIQKNEFDQIYTLLEENFIPEECREREIARTLLANPDFTVYHTVDGDNNVGFVTVWSFEDFDFIEHFVTYEAYRNKGYGARVLELLKSRGKILVLEAELPVDGIQKRRIAFYERNGFVKNQNPYVQPPYRQGKNGVPMVLLSCPSELSNFENTVKQLYQKVYNVNYEKSTNNT